MTQKKTPILVALDDSPRAAAVLRAADFYSKTTGAPLVLLSVIPAHVPLPAEALISEPAQIEALLHEQAVARLNKLGSELVPAVTWTVLVRTGVAWEVICDEAEKLGSTLIMLGSHGYDALDRVIGTTAQKVVNHATRNVLVVRNEPPWRKIVCALDGSTCSRAVFDAALGLGELFDSDLELVRGVTLPNVPEAALQRGVHLDELLLNDAKHKLKVLERQARECVRVSVHADIRSPRELVASRTNEPATLTVIGAHGYTLGERALGTTAAWFVNHLSCSVLIVREPEEAARKVTPTARTATAS
jgi:nucleotide-binding universal stress UspA family protein